MLRGSTGSDRQQHLRRVVLAAEPAVDDLWPTDELLMVNVITHRR